MTQVATLIWMSRRRSRTPEPGHLRTHILMTPTVPERTAFQSGKDSNAITLPVSSSCRPKPYRTRTSSRAVGRCDAKQHGHAEELNEQAGQIDVGIREAREPGNCRLLHYLDVGVLAVHERAEETHAAAFQVDDPHFGNVVRGVQRYLDIVVVRERSVADFNHQQGVAAGRKLCGVIIAARLQYDQIRLRLRDVAQTEHALDADERAAGKGTL